MTNQLCSSEHIFVAGSTVEVVTAHNETIVGEVFAFDYDSRVLILKLKSSNGSGKSCNITILNLTSCSEIKTISAAPEEPASNGNSSHNNKNITNNHNSKDATASPAIGAEGNNSTSTTTTNNSNNSNVKLPDIDFNKLDNRLANAVDERDALTRSFKSGAGINGVLLYHQLNKTFGDSVEWDGDCIIVRNNVTISAPFKTDCVSLRNPKEKLSDVSINYIKTMVDKFWKSFNGEASSATLTNSVNNLKLHSSPKSNKSNSAAGPISVGSDSNIAGTTSTMPDNKHQKPTRA